MSEATVAGSVNAGLRILLFSIPKSLDRAQNRIHAQQLDGALHKVETLLASAPEPLRSFLLYPLLKITGADRERVNSFAAELKRLRQVCARGIGSDFGHHPNYDPTKHYCASFAFTLIQGNSDKPITGTMDGPFRAITTLLYEAVSGKPGADLKRACDSCLAKSRVPPS